MDFKHFFYRFFLSLIPLLLNYIPYFFLTFSVISSMLSLALFDTTFTNGMLIGDIFKLFSIFNPKFSTGNYTINIADVMGVYFIISIFIFIIGKAIKYFYKLFTQKDLDMPIKIKIISALGIIFIIHLIGFISSFFASYGEHYGRWTMISAIFILFIISSASVTIYVFISEKIIIMKEKFFEIFSKIE